MNKKYPFLALVATGVVLGFTLFFPTSISTRSACPTDQTGPMQNLSFITVKTTKQGFPAAYRYQYKLTSDIECSAYKNAVLPISFLSDLLIIAVPGLVLAYLLSDRKAKKDD